MSTCVDVDLSTDPLGLPGSLLAALALSNLVLDCQSVTSPAGPPEWLELPSDVLWRPCSSNISWFEAGLRSSSLGVFIPEDWEPALPRSTGIDELCVRSCGECPPEPPAVPFPMPPTGLLRRPPSPAPPKDDGSPSSVSVAFLASIIASGTAVLFCAVTGACIWRKQQQLRREIRNTPITPREASEQLALCSVVLEPPHCDWIISQPRRYAIFLSHYKLEAGVAARYLHDLLQKMLRQPVFLDSSALLNLQALFTHGVQASDCLVLLMTEHVLERPWCLMEVWEATQHGLAIVPLWLMPYRRSKGIAEAQAMLRDLEANLEMRNPGAGDLLRGRLSHLSGSPSMETLQSTLLQIIVDSAPLSFDPMGTDFDMLASARALINELAKVRGQQLRWSEPNRMLPLPQDMPATSSGVTIDINSLALTEASASASASFLPTDASEGYLESARQLSAMLARKRDPNKPNSFYICYSRAECAAEARLIKLWLVKMTGCNVFLDVAENLSIQDILRRGVLQSQVLLLLQTKNVLSRPWVLAEVYVAAMHGMPVVPVLIDFDDDSRRYDFNEGVAFMENFWVALDSANPGAAAELRSALRSSNQWPSRPSVSPLSLSALAARFSKSQSRATGPEHSQPGAHREASAESASGASSRPGVPGVRMSGPSYSSSSEESARLSKGPPVDAAPSGLNEAGPVERSRIFSPEDEAVQHTLRELIPNLISRCKFRSPDEDQMVALVSEIVHTSEKLAHMMLHPYLKPEETLGREARAAAKAAESAVEGALPVAAVGEESIQGSKLDPLRRSVTRLTRIISICSGSSITASSSGNRGRSSISASVAAELTLTEGTVARREELGAVDEAAGDSELPSPQCDSCLAPNREVTSPA